MIRIRCILYKISLALIFGVFSTRISAQINMGARFLGMGQAGTALPGNNWSVFANPAMIPADEFSFGFYALRSYGLANLTDKSFVLSYPLSFGVAGAGIHEYGDELFRETNIRLSYTSEWKSLHIGLVLNYNHVAFGNIYGSGRALGINAGIAVPVSPSFWLGARATNINQPSYTDIEEELPRELALGYAYLLNDRVVISMDVVKDIRFPASFRSGLDIEVVEALYGRVGISTEPMTYSLGFGYVRDSWSLDMAFQQHQFLGLSPGIDLMFKL